MSTTKLCLGTVQFGLNYGINNSTGKPQKDKLFAMLDAALANGISFFDTAAAYGNAESLLGEYGIGKHKVRLISKLSLIGENCPNPEEIVEQQIQESLDRLGLLELEGYLLHAPQNFYNKRIIEGMQRCKEKGMIRNFGVSIYESKHALDVVKSGLVDYIQIPYNVLDQRLDQTDFFAMAKKNQVTVFGRSAFLQGLILMADDKIPEHLNSVKKYLHDFDLIISNYGLTRIQAAFLFAYHHPGIDHIVFGVDNMTQLQEYIELSQCQFDFSNCRQELIKQFPQVSETIICPNLWAQGSAR